MDAYIVFVPFHYMICLMSCVVNDYNGVYRYNAKEFSS